jgi:hypothetical protein
LGIADMKVTFEVSGQEDFQSFLSNEGFLVRSSQQNKVHFKELDYNIIEIRDYTDVADLCFLVLCTDEIFSYIRSFIALYLVRFNGIIKFDNGSCINAHTSSSDIDSLIMQMRETSLQMKGNLIRLGFPNQVKTGVADFYNNLRSYRRVV